MKTREYIDELRRKLLGIACEYGDLDTINTLTEAESYLRSMADRIEALTKEQELPDSPGLWWCMFDPELPPYWGVVKIDRKTNYGHMPEHEGMIVVSEEGYCDPTPGRWIKIIPPPE